jgi:transducin beta-like protein 2
LKDASKAKTSSGADRHADSELFITTLKGHTDAVNGVAFSADGHAIATACEDRCLRLFSVPDPWTPKNIPFKSLALRKGLRDVAFADTNSRVAALTRGMVDSGGLLVAEFGGKQPEIVWELEDIHPGKAPSLSLRASAGSAAGPSVLVACSSKPDLAVFTAAGTRVASVDTGGMVNYGCALSRDGRFLAAATFASDVKIFEVGVDRAGTFTGVKKAMDLKGHKSRILCVEFSPDLNRAATASADGTLKIYNLNVRYHMQEDPKILLSVGLALPPGQCYSRLAWGPDGHIAAVRGHDVHILDSRTGELLENIRDAHSKDITAAVWAPTKLEGPQGKVAVLATAGEDGRVRLWRAPWPL